MAEEQRIIQGRLYEHPEYDAVFGIFVTEQHFATAEWKALQDRAQALSTAHAYPIRIERVKRSKIVPPTSGQPFAVLANRNLARSAFEGLLIELFPECRPNTMWRSRKPGDVEFLWAMLIWETLQEF